MPTIELTTLIHAPADLVFDLARDVDAHTESTSQTGERAVAGRTSGLLELGDTVTWEAKHFGIRQRLKVEITEMDRPHYFEDRMLQGAFNSMSHRHDFSPAEDGASTLMNDRFTFVAPLWALGRLAEGIFLTAYMKRFLIRRNAHLKLMAEEATLGSTADR